MRVYRLLPPPETLETRDQEYLTYRTNRLKKEVQRTLYLEPESNERVELISNSAAMVAAGLAALWATTAQIPLLSGHFGETTSALFFAVAIGAYILKDRIKKSFGDNYPSDGVRGTDATTFSLSILAVSALELIEGGWNIPANGPMNPPSTQPSRRHVHSSVVLVRSTMSLSIYTTTIRTSR